MPAPSRRLRKAAGKARSRFREGTLPLVVDLAQDKAGAWIGSIIVPGLGIKGAPLANLVVTGSDVTFDIGSCARRARLRTGALQGASDCGRRDDRRNEPGRQRRAILAQADRVGAGRIAAREARRSRGDIADKWTGEFELGGYPRHVTITFENHDDAAATAQFVIVGKQTTNLPVDLVIEEGDLLRIESQATQRRVRRALRQGSRRDPRHVELGPFELPLMLRRAAGRAS